MTASSTWPPGQSLLRCDGDDVRDLVLEQETDRVGIVDG